MEQKDFIEKTACLIQKAYEINLKKRKNGGDELSACIDAESLKRRDVFQSGLRLLTVCTDIDYINKILSNMIAMEQNETARRFKTIQKEAVLGIHEEINSLLLVSVLFSFINDDEKQDIESRINDKTLLELLGL